MYAVMKGDKANTVSSAEYMMRYMGSLNCNKMPPKPGDVNIINMHPLCQGLPRTVCTVIIIVVVVVMNFNFRHCLS